MCPSLLSSFIAALPMWRASQWQGAPACTRPELCVSSLAVRAARYPLHCACANDQRTCICRGGGGGLALNLMPSSDQKSSNSAAKRDTHDSQKFCVELLPSVLSSTRHVLPASIAGCLSHPVHGRWPYLPYCVRYLLDIGSTLVRALCSTAMQSSMHLHSKLVQMWGEEPPRTDHEGEEDATMPALRAYAQASDLCRPMKYTVTTRSDACNKANTKSAARYKVCPPAQLQ